MSFSNNKERGEKAFSETNSQVIHNPRFASLTGVIYQKQSECQEKNKWKNKKSKKGA